MNTPHLSRRAVGVLGAAFAATTLSAVTGARAAASDQQTTVDHAVGTLQDLRHDKAFGTASSLIKRARAILIAPRIIKAGFFFGGEGGNAVLLARGTGGWSQPAFYTIGSGSFGLQIGIQQSELILFIMSSKALQAIMRNEFKIGATADITAVTLGSSVEAATTSNLNADIIAWASSSGAYIGISLDGSVIAPQNQSNANYYGRSLTAEQIVNGGAGHAAGSATLERTLNSLA